MGNIEERGMEVVTYLLWDHVLAGIFCLWTGVTGRIYPHLKNKRRMNNQQTENDQKDYTSLNENEISSFYRELYYTGIEIMLLLFPGSPITSSKSTLKGVIYGA